MVSLNDGGAGKQDKELRLVKNAGLIMGTNNSSIVSKRSVEKLYLPEPHFYRYFVRKPQRRSPTINRGYWLRMRAVDWVIRQFLEKPSDLRKVIINLGCGYDPVPFQWMARAPDLCQNVKWVDVDYDELMNSKRNIIAVTPRMYEMLTPKPDANPNFEKSILIDAVEYSAIGCDLRNLSRLDRLIKSVVDIDQCLVLCVAEVSITYMHTDAADALITWTATLSSDVTFCLLEQGSPDRPDNPFTVTMMNHFKKLNTPLHSVFKYPGTHTQGQRFSEAGFTHCECQNLWELWADARFLSPSQRLALDRIEPFDEWEEFALFASHYLLVIAHNRPVPVMLERPRSRRDSCVSITSNTSARTVSPYRPGAQWYQFEYDADAGDSTKRHHGSAYQIPGQDAIGTFGGIGPKGRLFSTAACRSRLSDCETPVTPPLEVAARSCHTVTVLLNGQNILVGGRGSPNHAMADCWLQTGSTWKRIHDLPEPRYRHRTVPVTLPDNSYGAVVFGGKTDASRVAADTLLWHPVNGWSVLRSLKNDPTPRFGASFVYLGFNHGILFGGMRQDGVICQGLWRWRLVVRDNRVAGISFRASKALDASAGSYPWFARLGASHGLIRDELAIIGGIAKAGTIPKPYEMLSLLGSFSAFNELEREMQLRLTSVDPPMPPGMPRPFLVGHSTHRTRTGMLVFMGGGATCFSFGNFFNSGFWIMHERASGSPEWKLVPVEPAVLQPGKTTATGVATTVLETGNVDDVASVPRASMPTSDSFLALLRASRPCVLKSLSFGECTQLWTPEYLRSKISPSRLTVVHNSPSRTMNFQRKDFTYETLPFSQFLDSLVDPSTHLYLRSVSSTATNVPANIEIDYPEISGDFQLPPQIRGLLSNKVHSSPLRISNNITMFLHYDVMSNVLFQIHGVKKLILFPPTDMSRLSFPPGSTTSTLDIFGNKEDDIDPNIPEGTTPQIAILHPGEALHIPALWSHAGISLRHDTKPKNSEPQPQLNHPKLIEPSSTTAVTNQYTNIALNVFFRTLPTSLYAAGRDVYGNRDIPAYEDGRRDLDKILRRFLVTRKDGIKGRGKDATTDTSTSSDAPPPPPGSTETTATTTTTMPENIFDAVPKDVAKAYLQRLADELSAKAAQL